MINNNHKDSGCGYSEQLISYLYDESNDAEKAVFEKHLATCPLCIDELEVFSGVHFSINDWKMKDFAVLETPAIEIPYEKAEKPVEVSSVASKWLTGLRDFFSFSPRAWTQATASLAVLVVCVGIALFAINERKTDELAGANKIVKPVVVPTVEKSTDQSNANKDDNNPSNKQKSVDTPKTVQPEVVNSNGTNSPNNRTVKISNPQRQTPKSETPNKQDVKSNKNPDNKKDTPVLSPYEDEEDDTLRLADLFDEIDTK